ncbi:MAG: hypothetical protein A3H98_05840, partial [Bacteroidetes bacterium RIFCSPLOWO2_02_FULL_36_8]
TKNRAENTPFPKVQEVTHRADRVYVVILLLFSVALYLNTLGNDYTVDDSIVLKENQFVKKGIAGIKDILTHDTFVGFFGKENRALVGGRYRPLTLVMFAFEYELWGENPLPNHLINILLYAIGVLLIYFMLRKIFFNYDPVFAFIPALLYAAHPLHVEVVANIKGRDEIVCLAFSCLAIIGLFMFFEKKKISYLAGAWLSFFLSLCAKETAITFLAVIPLILYFFTSLTNRKIFFNTLGFTVTAGIYLLIRQQYAGGTGSQPVTEVLNNSYAYATFGQKMATIAHILDKYFFLMFFPHPLTYDYSFNQIPLIAFSHPKAILAVALHLFLFIIALKQFKQKTLLSFCILYYFITISIVSNILFPIGAPMGERFLYQPSLAFCLIAGNFLLTRFNKKNASPATSLIHFQLTKSPLLLLILSIITLTFGIRTLVRNTVWKSNFSLFANDITYSPESAKALNALGGELVTQSNKETNIEKKKNMLNEAVVHLQKAVKIHPTYSNAWMLLGNAYYGLHQDADEAVLYYDNAIKANPFYADAHYNAGYILFNHSKPDPASSYLARLVRLSPNHIDGWYLLGLSYKEKKMIDSSLYCLKVVLSLQPNDYRSLQKLGLIYGEQNDLNNALVYLGKAIEVNQESSEAYINYGIANAKSGKLNEAIKVFSDALRKWPKNGEIAFNLSISYQNAGDTVQAAKYYKLAKELNPGR